MRSARRAAVGMLLTVMTARIKRRGRFWRARILLRHAARLAVVRALVTHRADPDPKLRFCGLVGSAIIDIKY